MQIRNKKAQLQLRMTRNGRSKGNTELLLLSPSANSAQTGGFSEKALAEEMKEREIEINVRDRIVKLFGGGVFESKTRIKNVHDI